MNFGLFGSQQPAPAPVMPSGPPPVEQVFNGANASTAYAKSLFTDVIEELDGANDAYDEVIMRAESEVARLTALINESTAKRAANVKTINNLTAFIDG